MTKEKKKRLSFENTCPLAQDEKTWICYTVVYSKWYNSSTSIRSSPLIEHITSADFYKVEVLNAVHESFFANKAVCACELFLKR